MNARVRRSVKLTVDIVEHDLLVADVECLARSRGHVTGGSDLGPFRYG